MSQVTGSLAELHPFHRKARAALLDLALSLEVEEDIAPPMVDPEDHRASGPFLRTDFADPEPALSRVRHAMLWGPAGVGKHHLALSVARVLEPSRVPVCLLDAVDPNPHVPETGFVIWVGRQRRRPDKAPRGVVPIEVRGLMPEERAHLVVRFLIPELTGRFGVDPAPYVQPHVLNTLIFSGEPEVGLHGARARLLALLRRRLRETREGAASSAWTVDALAEVLGSSDSATVVGPLPAGCCWAAALSGARADVARVEASVLAGPSRLQVTGCGPQAAAAVGVALRRLASLATARGMTAAQVTGLDWHIHVSGLPGPSDGSSLGLPALVAMASRLVGVPVASGVVVSGELTLEGQLLPVGGAVTKAVGVASRRGSGILLPVAHAADLQALIAESGSQLAWRCCSTDDEALKCVLPWSDTARHP